MKKLSIFILSIIMVSLAAFVACSKSPNGPDGEVEVEGIKLISIPGGTFQMGNAENDSSGSTDEKPVHSVTVSGFEMGIYEVTNAQYCAYLNTVLASGDITATSTSVKGAKGTYSDREYIYLAGTYSSHPDARCWITYSGSTFSVVSGHEKWPVVWVTWYGSKAFALYYGLDLPTEAEWEYACRGGHQHKYGTDDGTLGQTKANYKDNGPQMLVDVGSYSKNPYGLHDMSGNAWEWCHDLHSSKYYSISPTKDPSGSQTGTTRIGRGGSWFNNGDRCRSSARGYSPADSKSERLGFRVVRRVSPRNY